MQLNSLVISMAMPRCSVSQIMGLLKFDAIATLLVATSILLINLESGLASTDLVANLALSQANKTIEGLSGGSTDSHGCGFIPDSPSYKMDLATRIDYLRFTVEAVGGQPTLLVVGPNSDDSFCVLGDQSSGLNQNSECGKQVLIKFMLAIALKNGTSSP
ncbi:MAG: hypothetical protein HC930_04670 [Hydrococcus sp. SU_1_0]|nr:hypothetical protein [Hydrococcus sp. SU_1_0]